MNNRREIFLIVIFLYDYYTRESVKILRFALIQNQIVIFKIRKNQFNIKINNKGIIFIKLTTSNDTFLEYEIIHLFIVL